MVTVDLIGAGGHALDILDTVTIVGWFDHHSSYQPGGRPVIIGVNDPQLRARIAGELDIDDRPWIHPHAYLGPGCTIGHGTHINYSVSMTRTSIGAHCTIAPGVTICGDVTIGDRVFIGAGATIRNLVTIGDDAFIRMGSVVTRNVAPGERYR